MMEEDGSPMCGCLIGRRMLCFQNFYIKQNLGGRSSSTGTVAKGTTNRGDVPRCQDSKSIGKSGGHT